MYGVNIKQTETPRMSPWITPCLPVPGPLLFSWVTHVCSLVLIFASRPLLMAILIQTTRKHIWLGLSLFCVLWFDLFNIKGAIFFTFYFVHGDILQNIPKLHSISACACFTCMQVQCACRGRHRREDNLWCYSSGSICLFSFIIHSPRTHQVD